MKRRGRVFNSRWSAYRRPPSNQGDHGSKGLKRSVSASSHRLRTQCKPLHSHIRNLTDEQIIFAAAVNRVNRTELFGQLSCFTKLADDGSVQFHLVDLTSHVEVFRWIGVGAIEDLVRPRRDTEGCRRSNVGVLRFESSIVVEDLDPLICTVGHVYIALSIYSNRADGAELSGPISAGTPRFDEDTLTVEFGDSRIAHTVSYENVTGRIPRDISGPVKDVALSACSRKASAAGATALAATRTCGLVATRSRNRYSFWFPTQQQLRMSRRIELFNEVRHLIDDPDVVLWIDTDLLREDEPITSCSKLAKEFTGVNELQPALAARRELT